MELLTEKTMNDEVITDYKADAEVQPKRRGRPAKTSEPPAVVTLVVEEAPAPAQEAPAVSAEPEPYISPATLAEIEAGRRALGRDK
jgi:hypothetical protein